MTSIWPTRMVKGLLVSCWVVQAKSLVVFSNSISQQETIHAIEKFIDPAESVHKIENTTYEKH